FGFAENTDDLFVGKTLLHGDVLMWLMKTLLTSGCTNQRGAGHSKIADKVGDSPQKMMTELGKLQKQANGQVFKTVFGGKNGKEIEGMLSILDATKRASEANVVTKTGMTLAPLVRVIGNLKTGGALLAGETGIGLMSRVYESPMARNALLRLANTKAGTPAYERALSNAANAIRPLLATEATQQ
ncbi:hypothetical protein ACBQ06_13190, partial [Escherichia coli]